MPFVRNVEDSDFPLVLCGPILRRVEPRSVSVFVALKATRSVTLTLYALPDDYHQADVSYSETQLAEHQIQAQTEETVPLGKYLHVLAITLRLEEPLADLRPDRLYAYDMHFNDTAGGNLETLKSLKLLEGDVPLGYQPHKLPTFSLPPGLADLNIIHGSCRKPHGHGQDALAILDALIERDYQYPLKRPHQLFLTGDQIYADDVAISLLKTLTETGKKFLEWTETIPFVEEIDFAPALKSVSADDPRLQPGGARKKFLEDFTKYTSEYVEGHLMFLGEFYAMYLLAWSDVLWPRVDDAVPDEYDLPLPRDVTADFGHLREREVGGQRQLALGFAQTLPRVRRALANVPTYMAFDDHEVTDDWNLHRTWVDDNRDNPTSRRLLRNALTACAVFQDWGNQPDKYLNNPAFGEKFTALRYRESTGTPLIHDNPESLDYFFNIAPTSHPPPPASERMFWHYTVEGPEHRVLVLDTRTWRTFTSPKGNAALISPAIIHAQLPPGTPDKLTVIVSPAPVVGIPLIEEGLQKIYVASKGPEAGDNEAWVGNRAAFEDFLQRLAVMGRVVILSGDVHYAFTNHLAYFRDDMPTQPPGRIVQCCASSMKNQDTKTRLIGGIGHLFPEVGWLGFKDDLYALEKDLKSAVIQGITDQEEALQNLTSDPELARIYFDVVIRDRLSAPAVIPSSGWKNPASFQIVENLAKVTPVNPGTHWRYKVKYLSEHRNEVQKAATAPGLSALSEGDREHILAAALEIVGYNNLGQVTFTDNGRQVTHRLYWQAHTPADDILDIVMVTEHPAPLTEPSPSERPEVEQ